MTFEELVQYLHTLPGNRIEVHSWPHKVEGGAVHLAGVVTKIERSPVGKGSEQRRWRYFCQVGDSRGNGFLILC